MADLQLEQLERLCSEDNPCRPMITHTIGSNWIPSQNKTVKVTNLKNLSKTSSLKNLDHDIYDNFKLC